MADDDDVGAPTSSAVCGCRCCLPAKDPYCTGTCRWGERHPGLCACEIHIRDQYASPTTTAGRAEPPSTFPQVIEACRKRGIGPSGAARAWSGGQRSVATIANMSVGELALATSTTQSIVVVTTRHRGIGSAGSRCGHQRLQARSGVATQHPKSTPRFERDQITQVHL